MTWYPVSLRKYFDVVHVSAPSRKVVVFNFVFWGFYGVSCFSLSFF